MLIDIPDFEKMDAETAAREASRVLREMAGKINEELEQIRMDMNAKMKEIREGMKR